VSLLILAVFVGQGVGDPPEYKSLNRQQKTDYGPNQDSLMRIWTVYVGQGDGLLIQLPPKCNYDPDPSDDDSSRTETVDILIDGGSHRTENRTLMESFLLHLYDEPVTIEHAVITHHDGDHVTGLIHMLTGDSIGVDAIYHNGLASYRRGKRGFSNSTTATQAIRSISGGQLTRGMAFLEDDDDGQGKKLRDSDLIGGMNDLRQRLNDDEFQGVYDELASAVIDKGEPVAVRAFQRCAAGGSLNSFIAEREAQLDRGVNLSGIEFKLLWPLPRARKYGGWSETINGNSVTFRLDYGKFSMLFTGDHNEKSEEKLIEQLNGEVEILNVDVLKVPHHGSRLGSAGDRFFHAVHPALAILSVGQMHHLPAQETLDALERVHAQVWSTRWDGCIQLRTDGERLDVQPFRPRRGRVERSMTRQMSH